MNKYIAFVIISATFYSCQLFEPDRQEIAEDYKKIFTESKTEFNAIANDILIERKKHEIDIRLTVIDKSRIVWLREHIYFRGKMRYSLMNEYTDQITNKYYDRFVALNIYEVRTNNNTVRIQLQDTPSYYYDVFYVLNKQKNHGFNWCFGINNDWQVCGIEI